MGFITVIPYCVSDNTALAAAKRTPLHLEIMEHLLTFRWPGSPYLISGEKNCWYQHSVGALPLPDSAAYLVTVLNKGLGHTAMLVTASGILGWRLAPRHTNLNTLVTFHQRRNQWLGGQVHPNLTWPLHQWLHITSMDFCRLVTQRGPYRSAQLAPWLRPPLLSVGTCLQRPFLCHACAHQVSQHRSLHGTGAPRPRGSAQEGRPLSASRPLSSEQSNFGIACGPCAKSKHHFAGTIALCLMKM